MDTFRQVIDSPSISGKWFCSANYSFMSKKQKEWLKGYMKDPSDNGRLVISCSEYKDYKELLKNKIILNSSFINLIQLSFPYRTILEAVVKNIFESKGVYIEQRAIELFIMRMSSSYDNYEEVIDKILVESVPSDMSGQGPNWKYTITYDDTLSAMKGIENFVLDDLLERLLIPLKSDKTNGKNKTYRMLGALLEEMGPQQLVNKLRYKVDDYIEFRLAINRGIIPIRVKFYVEEAKKDLGESNKITKYSDYTFRKMAIIASQTSLRDWTYMRLLLNNIKYRYKPTSYERALYSLTARSVLNVSRLDNDIGIDNILRIGVNELNKIPFSESYLPFYEEKSITEV